MSIQTRITEVSAKIDLLSEQINMLQAIVYQNRLISTFLLNNFSTTGFVYTPPSTLLLKSGAAEVLHFTSPALLKAANIKKMYDHVIISSSLVP